ncbi:hypothetical protein [Thalassomonas actiniarum]|uniref:Uncharacterized protein n=1 Tax=Thalassomonas actiniarum TaxID=485447 RepID=A0AAF0C2A3_9GAMM|nr:hypothetical protein [Thalassomonas actiniarum]WDD97585.1 hypothetical protein SG35_020020 [Thalassomonas actiniarum]
MKYVALLLHVVFRFTLIATLALIALVPLVYEISVLTAFVYMPLLLIAIAVLNLATDHLLLKMVQTSAAVKTRRYGHFFGRYCIFCS